MLATTLALILGITTTISQEIRCAKNQVCSVNGNNTLVVIADKDVPALVINCISNNGCKKDGLADGLIVYSSANKTYVICEGEDSCEEISLNFGITPNGELSTDFEVTRDDCKVECLGKQACKSIEINNEGIITQGLKVITSDSNDGTVMGGTIECGLDTQCSINCQDITLLPDTCKDTKCYGNCVCTGTGCPADLNVRPTPEPTQSPVGVVVPPPTPEPTPSPIDPRNSTSCDVGTCILEPTDNYDVDCALTATKCVVKCIGENICAEGVIIQANSAEVEIECEESNSCDKVRIFGIAANSITITLNGEKAAENMMIIVDNPGASVNIIANGVESFSNGRLFCDADCELDCLGSDSCKSTTYECLNTNDKCTCLNNCPVIQFFGDQSCSGQTDCVVTPDGNSRVVALNNVNKLTVDCSEAEQCKKDGSGLKIFSAAKETVILCNNLVACEEISVNVGDLKGSRVPKGFTEAEFVVSLAGATMNSPAEVQRLDMNCDAEGACKGMDLYTTGSVNTKILGDGEGALEGGNLLCDDCESLNFECKDFDGCPGLDVFCPPVAIGADNRCVCEPIYVFVNLTLETTEAPRDTCPPISVLTARMSGVIAQSNVNGIISTGTRALVAFAIVGSVLVLAAGFIFMKCKKNYQEIKDGNNNNEQMLKNENIYATYQVEMH